MRQIVAFHLKRILFRCEQHGKNALWIKAYATFLTLALRFIFGFLTSYVRNEFRFLLARFVTAVAIPCGKNKIRS